MLEQKKYPVITICGSTRFVYFMDQVKMELTKEGNIVIPLSVIKGRDYTPDEITDKNFYKMLEEMHYQKILMSDKIAVVMVDGYIGESTSKEIDFAKAHGKEVLYFPRSYSW